MYFKDLYCSGSYREPLFLLLSWIFTFVLDPGFLLLDLHFFPPYSFHWFWWTYSWPQDVRISLENQNIILALVKYVLWCFSKRDRRSIDYSSSFLWEWSQLVAFGQDWSSVFLHSIAEKTHCRRWTYNNGYFIIMRCLEKLSTGNITWGITLCLNTLSPKKSNLQLLEGEVPCNLVLYNTSECISHFMRNVLKYSHCPKRIAVKIAYTQHYCCCHYQ